MRKLVIGLVAVMATLIFALPAIAQVTNPKIAIHLKEKTKGDFCVVNTPTFGCATGDNGDGGTGFVTSGISDGTAYAAYLVAVLPIAEGGVQGAAFGISMDAAVQATVWNECADQSFTSAGWPATGESATVTWVSCQNNSTGSVTPDGIQGIMGWIYIYAYSPGFATITKRLNTTGTPDLNVVNCGPSEIAMEQPQAGSVRFSVDGAPQGCNPCVTDCSAVPVEATTWGSIKSQFHDAGE